MYPLVVDLIIGMQWLSKVLMDEDSSLNIMYAKTLNAMGISRSCILLTRAPFHGVVPGKQAISLGQIDLPVTFGDPSNYRTKTLTFEVVGFHRTYHAILRHPCYAKFMAIPSYTNLKLKMSGPCGVECCDHAMAIVASKKLATIRKEVDEETPDHQRLARSFELVEGAKEVLIDPSGSKSKVVHISTALSSE
ncbi:uncharacterized protein [Miscanthus floridulus]|uniref:uncharacterized protein n=1 Tax=Miscanthus floridulus TaxID=154761 RepID=UPI00345976E9